MIELPVVNVPAWAENSKFWIGQRVMTPHGAGTVIAFCKSSNSALHSVGVEHDNWNYGHSLLSCGNVQWPKDAEAREHSGYWYTPDSLGVIA